MRRESLIRNKRARPYDRAHLQSDSGVSPINHAPDARATWISISLVAVRVTILETFAIVATIQLSIAET